MDDVLNICSLLTKAGVKNVDQLRQRLFNNQANDPPFKDLLFEAASALAFQGSGFQVKIRERPDLHVSIYGSEFFAEVKHFRRKKQDDLDEKRLREAGELFVQYGDTTGTERKEGWEQVVEVIKKKVPRYGAQVPLILVLCSSSEHCIEDIEVQTAVNEIDSAISADPNSDLRKFNGVLLLSPQYSQREGSAVFFFKLKNAAYPFSPKVEEALKGITNWKNF